MKLPSEEGNVLFTPETRLKYQFERQIYIYVFSLSLFYGVCVSIPMIILRLMPECTCVSGIVWGNGSTLTSCFSCYPSSTMCKIIINYLGDCVCVCLSDCQGLILNTCTTGAH